MLVYGECECFVIQMLYVCVLCASCGSSQCCVLHDLQFVNAGRGCNRRPYRRGILQSRSHNCFIGSHECLLLFTPSCCRTFGCVAMGSALLFIVLSRLLVYSAGSGVNRVQVVLSGFNKRLFCFVQAKTLCRYGCMYFLAALVLVCVDVIVMSSA